jgi:hypothetical protein
VLQKDAGVATVRDRCSHTHDEIGRKGLNQQRGERSMHAQIIRSSTTREQRAEMNQIVIEQVIPALRDEPGCAGAMSFLAVLRFPWVVEGLG